MATGIAYEVRSVPGQTNVFQLGSAANPSIVFGNPNLLGGMNDGFYATSTPTIGLSINGSSVATWSASGMVTGNIATSGTLSAASLAATGAITSSSPTAGIGYATGAGGSITQGTNKSTGVTLNTLTGAITMNNAALAAGAVAKFTVTDSAVDLDDVIVIHHSSAGTAGIYHVDVTTVTAGSFAVAVQNYSGTSASEAIVLSFAVIKSVAA